MSMSREQSTSAHAAFMIDTHKDSPTHNKRSQLNPVRPQNSHVKDKVEIVLLWRDLHDCLGVDRRDLCIVRVEVFGHTG